MPAGPRYIYYGVALTNEHLFHILDPEGYEDDDGQEGALVSEYLDDVEQELRGYGHTGELFQVVDHPIYTTEPDAVCVVYGFRIGEYKVFDPLFEVPRPRGRHVKKVHSLIRALGIKLAPRTYTAYSGG